MSDCDHSGSSMFVGYVWHGNTRYAAYTCTRCGANWEELA